MVGRQERGQARSKEGRREGVSEGWVNEGGNKRRDLGMEGGGREQGEGGSYDARQAESVDQRWKGGLREGVLAKGTSWPVYRIFTNHPTKRPLPLTLCYYK